MDKNITVLYVEDDPQSRKIMKMLLQRRLELNNITIFENSEDFLNRVSALAPAPDVIFLDIHVKPFDGFEMLAMLRGMHQFGETPIVALTASVMNEEVQKLRSAGFSGCLAKPLDMSTFSETFRQILRGEILWRIIEH